MKKLILKVDNKGNYFETERLLLKPITSEDFNSFYALSKEIEKASDVGICMTFFYFYVPKNNINREKEQFQNVKKYFDRILKEYELENPLLYFVGIFDKSSNKFIGGIDIEFMKEKQHFDLGYFLSPSFQRKGLGFEAVTTFLKHFFEQFDEFVATVHPENMASKRMIEKLGGIFVENQKNSIYGGEPRLLYKITKNNFYID